MKQRHTKQRRLILEEVQSRCDHPTADQIYLAVRAKDGRISRGTVYRNLGILEEEHELTHVKVPAADRYDSRVDPHYHMVCTRCGAVMDAPFPYQGAFDQQTEPATGFRIECHRTVFEGLCAECQRGQSPEAPPPGSESSQ